MRTPNSPRRPSRRPPEREISTQAAFGRILDHLARSGGDLVDRIVTTSPDVTGTTSLGPWVNRRKLFARGARPDVFKAHRIPSTAKWEFSPDGQHVELGIAEMNLCLLLAAAGLAHSLFGRRLIPIGTVYDPFVARALDALNYACYQDARFLLVGTPSGVTLAPEGGAHQSIGTPLIGMSQPGLTAFEPAFADELAIIMEWAFAHLQRDGAGGGSVYLRLTTNPLEQPLRQGGDRFAADVVAGGYWMRPPGPNCEAVIAYQGAVAGEAIRAAGRVGGARRDVGLLAVTSADRLHAGWTEAQRAREAGDAGARAHVEALLGELPAHCALVTVIDGHPATLSWLGGVAGRRTLPLGVEAFGQTGTIAELYRCSGIDAEAIVRRLDAMTAGRRMLA
ncbi:pyruvate dehydrogenase E1 component [Rubrimonas cliftonensis]|uniref:Pyruvate dehydrogenase E1 component n=1 Tax=Rubrimonas cliftonensis TaxID=89524 RepID=A0A1H4GD58_9RHOB|nr:pyruvate dehydrogenase E1 component [Rubrimonas cliftonensis]